MPRGAIVLTVAAVAAALAILALMFVIDSPWL